MKKFSIFLTIFFLGMSLSVQAKTCTVNFFTYFGIDYVDVPYCDGNNLSSCTAVNKNDPSPKNLCSSGCYALTVASILKSYGENVNPKDVASFLCEHHYNQANSVTYSSISQAEDFKARFSMDIERLSGHDLSEVDQALSEGYMVLASINANSAWSGNGGHYVAIAAKRNEEYFILNTATQEKSEYKYPKWFSKDTVQKEMIKEGNVEKFGQAWWKVKPKDCDTVNVNYLEETLTEKNPSAGSSSGSSSSGTSGGSMTDTHSDFFPNIEGTKCTNGNESTIFVDCNGEYTLLKEFLDDIFLLIKIAAPVLVIVLSTIDYVKSIASANADALKKTNKKTVMRLIIGLFIFLLPYILELLFQLFGLYDINTSGIGR